MNNNGIPDINQKYKTAIKSFNTVSSR